MEIYIIRHTRVAVGKDTCYGQSNVPLATTFDAEVAQFKTELPTDFDAVYCSPLQRCRDLADALQLENIIVNEALMEMNFGDWEGQKWNDINQDLLNEWMQDFTHQRTPNGENLMELYERIKVFLDNLKQKPHKKALIVCHAGVIRCVWAYVLGIPLSNIFKLNVGYNEVFIVKLNNNPLYDAIKRKQ